MPITASAALGLFDRAVDRLTPVPLEQRHAFQIQPATRQVHAQMHAAVSAFREVEIGGAAPSGAVTPLRIAAWNLERCLYPAAAAHVLRAHGASLSLLTEMDAGMLRTGQTHAIAEMAADLGQGYGYGLEFLELAAMPPPQDHPARGEDNDRGFHGNGFVTALAFEEPTVIRLDETADWFVTPKDGQRRIGNRIAVAATFDAGFPFVACAVHLESVTDGLGRAAQMRTLLDALDGLAAGLPVVIGGDLNTQVGPGGHDNPAEPLFAVAGKRGYDLAACNLARPTTRESVWSTHEGTRQLDWFLTRGVVAQHPAVVPALGPDGTVLSDHELILVTIAPG